MANQNKRRQARNQLNEIYRKIEIEKDPITIAELRAEVRRIRKQKILLKVNTCDNPKCQEAIYEGQQVIKVGTSGIYCNMGCWADSIGAVTISV